jgi:hypothetical protein
VQRGLLSRKDPVLGLEALGQFELIGRNHSGTCKDRIPARDLADVILRIRPLSSRSFTCLSNTSPERSPNTRGMLAAIAACLTLGLVLVAWSRQVARYFRLSSSESFGFPQCRRPSAFTSAKSVVSVRPFSRAFRQKDFANTNMLSRVSTARPERDW